MDPQFLLNQAVSLHRSGKLAEAEKLYRQLLESEKGIFQAWYLFAILRYQQQRGGEALEAAETALKLNPAAPEALNLRGVLLQAAARHEEALASFGEALASKPDYAEAWYNRGQILADLRRSEEAVEAFDRALAIQPNAAAWDSRGIALRALGRQAEALASFEQALAIDPRHAKALNNRGSALQDLKRFDEALASFDRALAIEPDNAVTLNNRGAALRGLERLPEALASCDRALAVKPDFAAALRNRGSVLQSLKRFDEALASFDRAVGIDPHNTETLSNRAAVLFTLQRFDESLACANRALAIQPDYPPALLVRSLALCEAGHIAEGLASYTRRAEQVHGGNAFAVPGPAHKQRHDREQRDYLAAEGIADGKFHLADGARVAGGAVHPNPAAEMQWQTSHPQVVVIDNLLTAEALERLRRFCRGSTVWLQVHDEGYLGATLEHGFACPLLAQIAEELRSSFPAIFRGHELRQLWGYKYDSTLGGIKIHADQAAVNVNFWITPDEANLDPEHGGLVIWDVAAPLDWDVAQYNGDEAAARAFLARTGAKPVTVPYRANRAVIFDSDLFHETDRITFREGYINRRINVTMLFGRRTFHGG